jgi:toxin ParE1/3/4
MSEIRQVRWTAPAAQDLREIVRFIRKDKPDAALSVAKTIFDLANSLNTSPFRGRSGRLSGTRELIVPNLPYIIVYQVTDTASQILRIFHAARNWP